MLLLYRFIKNSFDKLLIVGVCLITAGCTIQREKNINKSSQENKNCVEFNFDNIRIKSVYLLKCMPPRNAGYEFFITNDKITFALRFEISNDGDLLNNELLYYADAATQLKAIRVVDNQFIMKMLNEKLPAHRDVDWDNVEITFDSFGIQGARQVYSMLLEFLKQKIVKE